MLFKIIKLPAVIIGLVILTIGCLSYIATVSLVESDNSEEWRFRAKEEVETLKEMWIVYLIEPFMWRTDD